ncbi:MAG: ATP-dependent metallopeptidase FtsH/Yme1/Tma family protein, partial [Fischerella sp.]|nr:ATP-dependent metallopeptidase FtsH/Yme1/Tma family protein [Fischerella sp.]
MNNKRWRNAGLYALLFIVVIALGTAFFDKQPQSRETWRYSQFIQEVQNGRVDKVSISADRSTAIVTPISGEKKLVTLVNDPDLINTLNAKGVDIIVLPQTDEGFWFKALSSLFFPVLLLVGLFFLLRRAQNGPGSQAMNFGKSRARVQMEPQTQVTFGDVAGIDQAKLELNEVVDFLKNADRFTAVGAKIPKGVLL